MPLGLYKIRISDLSVKLESPATERVKSEWGNYSSEGTTKPPTPERMPANMWAINVNSGKSTKVAASHKGSTATTTPDGE